MALGRGVVPRRVSEHSRGCLWGLRLDLGATAETPVTVLFWREELVAEIMQVWGTSLEGQDAGRAAGRGALSSPGL